MISTETDRLMAKRLENLENGVVQLDTRVASLDDKVTHVLMQNAELAAQQGEEFRSLRTQLNEQRVELRKSIRKLTGGWTTKCHLKLFGGGLVAWTFFMAWVMWS